VLALSSVVKSDGLQLVRINYILRYAFKDPTNVGNIIDMLVHIQISSSWLQFRNKCLSALEVVQC